MSGISVQSSGCLCYDNHLSFMRHDRGDSDGGRWWWNKDGSFNCCVGEKFDTFTFSWWMMMTTHLNSGFNWQFSTRNIGAILKYYDMVKYFQQNKRDLTVYSIDRRSPAWLTRIYLHRAAPRVSTRRLYISFRVVVANPSKWRHGLLPWWCREGPLGGSGWFVLPPHPIHISFRFCMLLPSM